MSVSTPADAERLTCGSGAICAPRALLKLAEPRCALRPFQGSPARESLTITTVPAIDQARRRALEGSLAPWGFYAVEGDTVLAHIPDDMWAAESVLRLAWQIVTHRQGGVLMHGCALAFGDRAVAAIGRSGAGKSTLSSLCSRSATVLTDEISQLFPDGRVHGTPFRSNVENVGSPRGATLASLLVLEKGLREAIEPVEATQAVPELVGQLYRVATDEVPQSELLRRVLALVDRVGVHRLTFRKDAAVAPFLREWIESRVAV
jgi:hypothetical protein